MGEDELYRLQVGVHGGFLFQRVIDLSEHTRALYEFLNHLKVLRGMFCLFANGYVCIGFWRLLLQRMQVWVTVSHLPTMRSLTISIQRSSLGS